MKSAKEEFINIVAENSKVDGLDDLSAKILGILYVEPKEVALEELAKRTGYSLSSVSTAMKFMERAYIVKRIKKPRSRKIYFYMEKDMFSMLIQIMKRKYDKVILPTKERFPQIIEKYKKDKSKYSKKEMKIVESYYKQVVASEKMLGKMINMLEGIQKVLKKRG